ncbi:MAG: hypothetical protein WB780_05510 [Candidatus Acidiferrales bacterium]
MSSGEQNKIAGTKTLAGRIWAGLVAVWIAGVLLVFLVIRVAGSKLAEAVLHRVRLH